MNQRRNLLWLGLLIASVGAAGLFGAPSSIASAASNHTKALLLITTSQDGETAACG
jgi:hypothetical protein